MSSGSKKKAYMQITVRTRSKTIGWEVGERIVDSLYVGDGLLVPEQVSDNPDRFRKPFEGKAQCKAMWTAKGVMRGPHDGVPFDVYFSFAWRRKKVLKCMGYVDHTTQNKYLRNVPGRLNFSSACSEKIDWYALFKTWCEILPPQVAMLHLFTEPEISPDHKDGPSGFELGSFRGALDPRVPPEIPNAAWAMAYGNEFADKVDAERIAAAGFPIEKLGEAYLVRVTENVQDVAKDFPRFSQRRAELKRLFPEDFFEMKNEPPVA